MKRITNMLVSAGALALAACSGGETADSNETTNAGGTSLAANAAAPDVNEAMPAAQVPAAAPASKQAGPTVATPAPPRPAARPKAAPAEQPKQAAPRQAPSPEPAPPPKDDCAPEHRAAGHC